MADEYTSNYDCKPKWFTAADTEVIASADGPHAVDLNVTCVVKTGNIQFQVKDEVDQWFTPAETAYTITASNLVRLPRANMPDTRILATGDATFMVTGALT